MLQAKLTPKNLTGWTYGKQLLSDAYGYEYLADTWPERLVVEDIAALQAAGKEYPVFEAWRLSLTKAAEAGELTTKQEQWFLGSYEPSEFWTEKEPKLILIPPCHKYQGDDILLFKPELMQRATASPENFADFLQKANEQPSKYIAAWFGAFGIETEEPQAEAVEDNGAADQDDTKPEQSESNESDASLGRAYRERLTSFANRNKEKSEERQEQWKKWKAEGERIQNDRAKKLSKVQLAKKVKESLKLPDKIGTIRKKI